jgi:hypothetical protein
VLGTRVGDGLLDELTEHGAIRDGAEVQVEVLGPGLHLGFDLRQRRQRRRDGYVSAQRA